jgi:hypothetical protein
MADSSLDEACAELCAAVDGVDWAPKRVSTAVTRIHALSSAAPPAALDAALEVLVARLRAGRLEDGDGLPHVAITGGALVERGASPGPLGRALLEKLPGVLAGARRFADACLPEEQEEEDAEDDADESEEDVLVRVDGRAILRAVFRERLPADRAGGCALAYLTQWTLSAVACLSRDRALLVAARQDDVLRARASAMASSDASFLHVLLGAALDTSAIVLHPVSGRGFRMRVDGVCSNFDLRALVEDVLMERGLPGKRNPPAVLAYLRGATDRDPGKPLHGAFNLYTHRAARFDTRVPSGVPTEHWVWNEGVPDDVPRLDGQLVLLAGPPMVERSWNSGRVFEEMRPSVVLEGELSKDEVRRWLERCAEA